MPVRIRRPEPISRRVDQQVDHRPDKPGTVVRLHARRPDVSADSKTWLAAVLHTAPEGCASPSADQVLVASLRSRKSPACLSCRSSRVRLAPTLPEFVPPLRVLGSFATLSRWRAPVRFRSAGPACWDV